MPDLVATRRNSNPHQVDEELINTKLDEFRKMIVERKKFECPMDDHFLSIYIRARKYNLEQAYKRLENSWVAKRIIFDDGKVTFLPSAHRELILKKYVSMTTTRDTNGNLILVFRTGRWNPCEFTFDDFFGVIFFVIYEAISSSIEIQIKGISVLLDLKEFGFRHMREFSLSRCRNILKFAQDAYPVRIKGIYIVNNPRIFSMLYEVGKVFLKDKMRKRLNFHGYDMSSLHKMIPPESLPVDLGGELLSYDECLDNDIFERLLTNDEYYKELDKYNNSTCTTS